MIFYSIEIIHNREKITLRPVACLRVTDDSNRIVVVYGLAYYLHDVMKHSAYINYYLSDGNTNKLRANMLFPFLCYHQKDSKTCITISGNHSANFNLLVKVSNIKNINMNKFNTSILTKTKGQIHKKNKKSWKESEEMIIEYLEDIYYTKIKPNKVPTNISEFNFTVDAAEGLVSVVPRIENLLDLIIALYSDPLINIVSIEHYEPIPYDHYTKMGIDYFDFRHTCKTLNIDPDDYEYFEDQDFIVDTALRENLVKELNNLITMLIKTRIFNASAVNMDIIDVNKAIFNSTYAKICKDNTINHEKKINYGNYFKISQLLLQLVTKKINVNIQNYNIELCKINKVKGESIKDTVNRKLFNKKIDELNRFKSMLLEKTLYRTENLDKRENVFLEKNISSWSGKCN
jgi:hypothetical protein